MSNPKIMLMSLCCLILVGAILAQAQSSVPTTINAIVSPDSAKEPPIRVSDLKLDFVFAGYGIYVEAEYPLLLEIPLMSGERVHLEKISQVSFHSKRVNWKKYVKPTERAQHRDIDSEGYRHWSDIEVDVYIKDLQGNLISGRIQRPEYGDIYLVGKTERGDFKLQVDQENNKTVLINILHDWSMQCEKNPLHVFSDASWKFCPICGGKLKKSR